MNSQRQIKLKKIRNITIAWTLVGIFVTLYDHLLLHSNISQGHFEGYSFGFSLFFNTSAGIIGGMVGGWFITTINHNIRSKPYIHALWWGLLGFTTIVVVLSILFAIIATLFLHDYQLNSPEAKVMLQEQFFSTLHLKNYIFWAVVTLFTQFSLQISDKFGPGNLWNILTGKYHIPKNEARIFMFLDLKSSTTIAEKLGEEKYHEFLQDVFSDITDPIRNCKAEIYQYVGDEVIITWKLDKIANKANCLNVFFEIKEEFEKQKETYLKKYDTLPSFKAGAHIGNAIVGEIGIIKKDITYSGDLLNTSARIQAECNAFNSVLLISSELKNFLVPDPDNWELESKGFIQLRGKTVEVELFDVGKK